MITGELAGRARELIEQRIPFVVATVVGARRPTSVRPGDSALVLSDGKIEGFVGGVCAESTVRLYSLRALETGEPVLLRLVPGEAGTALEQEIEGAVIEHNPCLSGGALEIFIEPQLPAARLGIIGASPIAVELRKVATAAGYDVCDQPAAGDAAVIVASHGSNEEGVLVDALSAGVPYVALVASRARGASVRDALDVPEELRGKLHTPAGLDIGARTPAEIAISILAELVAEHHAGPGPAEVAVAVDPICGMKVPITREASQLLLDGQPVYFCCDGCRDAYAAQHAL